MKKTPQIRDVERGEMLRFLAEFYPSPVTPKMLLYHLDDSAYSVSEEDLHFHVEYLAQKGFLTYELEERIVGEQRRIHTVKISPAGIDYLDRRQKGDSGVRL